MDYLELIPGGFSLMSIPLPEDGHFVFYLQMKKPVQSLSRVRFFVTPWTAARQVSLSITNSQSLLPCLSSDAIQPSHPPSSPSPVALLAPDQRRAMNLEEDSRGSPEP